VKRWKQLQSSLISTTIFENTLLTYFIKPHNLSKVLGVNLVV
jgi:hypothetical protein